MRLSVDREKLYAALKVTGTLAKQSHLPIFSCVLLQKSGDGISVTTSDLETQLSVQIDECDERDMADIAVSHRVLTTFVSSSTSDRIEMSIGGNGLIVKDESGKALMPVMNPDDFTLMREDDLVESFSGDHAELSKSIEWCLKAAVGGDERPTTRSIHFSSGKIYASNGKFLTVADAPLDMSITLDRESIKPIKYVLDGGDESAWMCSDKLLGVKCGPAKLLVRSIDVTWPTNAVPHIIGAEEGLLEWGCSVESLTNAIRRVLQITPNEFSRVTLQGEMVISQGRGGDSATILMDGEVPETISCSGPMLCDMVGGMSGPVRSSDRIIRIDSPGKIGVLAPMREAIQ